MARKISIQAASSLLSSKTTGIFHLVLALLFGLIVFGDYTYANLHSEAWHGGAWHIRILIILLSLVASVVSYVVLLIFSLVVTYCMLTYFLFPGSEEDLSKRIDPKTLPVWIGSTMVITAYCVLLGTLSLA